jgi:hypothetical protein
VTTYTNPDCAKFVEDLGEAGIETEHYRGRWFWQGPAARTDEGGWPSLQDVIRATDVKLQWDNLGRDWIVYPVASDPGTEA